MKENTYYLWDVVAANAIGQSVARIMAWTEQDAIEKAQRLLPGRESYAVSSFTEFWLPGVNTENVAKALKEYGEKLPKG